VTGLGFLDGIGGQHADRIDKVRLHSGFDLKRFSLFSSGLPDDPNYKWNEVEQDQRTWFRPSDAAVGTDGAIYVADWFDPIVGGHAMQDPKAAGTIYRIAPKGKALTAPKIDIATLDGQIAALKSPAPNVRFLGFEKLRARGEEVLAEVSALRNDDNPYVRARMVWLMAPATSPSTTRRSPPALRPRTAPPAPQPAPGAGKQQGIGGEHFRIEGGCKRQPAIDQPMRRMIHPGLTLAGDEESAEDDADDDI